MTFDAAQMRALRWRCRRGMRELDQLLAGYLEQHFADADSGHQQAFLTLLDMQDPVIFGYLVGREVPEDDSIKTIISRILSDTDTSQIRT